MWIQGYFVNVCDRCYRYTWTLSALSASIIFSQGSNSKGKDAINGDKKMFTLKSLFVFKFSENS